ncbi:hypothetical protein NDU88_000754 [Pleurodeles waltl]|uniref:Uncharacterized protein n=1 Tax=Pleurodeles waltl TaxID=8319 RepID=A0AAV7TH67_PLEWA|nr:hypothetical protein NDU88_000754 [Pleurodeles waltl]
MCCVCLGFVPELGGSVCVPTCTYFLELTYLAPGRGVDLLYPWGTTQVTGEDLWPISHYGRGTQQQESEKPRSSGEETGRARRRTLAVQQRKETQSVKIGEGKQDGKPKQEITEDGRHTTRREIPPQEGREGELYTRKPATFQEERGSSTNVNGAGKGNVIISGEGIEDRKKGKNCNDTN